MTMSETEERGHCGEVAIVERWLFSNGGSTIISDILSKRMHKKYDLLSGFVNFQTKMSNNACYAYELKTIKLFLSSPEYTGLSEIFEVEG